MTTYNTGNPIGSTDPRDLYDNAQNLDTAMHTAATTWADRLGNSRPSWAGATGYQSLGDYAAGIQVTTYNQVIRASGEYWRAAAGTVLPYTTTGAGMPESGKFVSVGDAMLRADLVDGDGSSLVGFQQSGAGAVVRTAQDKMREWVSVKDFGAVGDGATDDTAAIQSALNSMPIGGGTVIFPTGNYLVSGQLSLSQPTRIIGDGNSLTPPTLGRTTITKSASVVGPVLLINKDGSTVEGIHFEGAAGNSGDGVTIAAGRIAVRDCSSHKMGGDGFRVGTDAAGNFNCFHLERCYSRYNGRHGFYIHHGIWAPDANGGMLVNCEAALNSSDGLRIYQAWFNTVIGFVAQVNGGYGIYLKNDGDPSYIGARDNTIVGGDQSEGNALAEVRNDGYLNRFYGTDHTNFINTDPIPGVFNCLGTKARGITSVGAEYVPALFTGFSASTFNAAAVENIGNPANGRGVGFEFRVPNGSNTARAGGNISCAQATTNTDNLTFSVNKNGAITALFVADAITLSLRPASDDNTALGWSSNRWSTVYAGTATINTSDARKKQQVRSLSEAERAVAVSLKSLVRMFRFNDAVEAKGQSARIHCGVIAQDVKAAFEAAGLDPFAYAVLCYDEWDSTIDANGNEVSPAGSIYGVRYEELIAFIISAL